MAVETFKRDKAKASKSKAATTIDEQMDDITEQAGSNRNFNSGQESEKLVKWQIPGHHDHTGAKKILIQLLASLLINHPNEVNLIDRKQRSWSFDENQAEERFLKEFDTASVSLHAIKRKDKSVAKWIAITKLVSTTNPPDWKNNDSFYSMITEAKTYIFPHPFGPDEWDIVSIGFIRNIHAVHYPKEVLHHQLHSMLSEQENLVPIFQVIPQRITTDDKKASTKAYAIQCLKEDATAMIKAMTNGPFREAPNQIFVPFRYKKTKPTTFLHCIRQQNEVYHKTWIIKLEGITHEAMQYIEQDLLNITGIWHVVPTKRTQTIGEWKVLTDHAKCAYIHKQLSTLWDKIISNIPSEVLAESPEQFSIPMISSKRARDYQDDDSDDDSYGSLLTTGTEVSAMTAEDNAYNELPSEYTYPTYAAAAMASNDSISDTGVSSPTTSTYPEWQKEKQDLEEKIRNHALQIEKLQADLQTRISRSQDLEEQLAQAIDLAHTRDARHEEMLEKFEQLMNMQQNKLRNASHTLEYPSHEGSNPTTPERALISAAPPPQKKANTNSSPNRTIYALFRQSQGKQYNSRQSNIHKTTPTKQGTQATYQPMDIEDTTRKPTPGEKSGNGKE